MPYKKHKTHKRKQSKRSTHSFNEPLKTVNMGIKATTGIAVLGITASALTNIAKK